jgi:hypothetical protein
MSRSTPADLRLRQPVPNFGEAGKAAGAKPWMRCPGEPLHGVVVLPNPARRRTGASHPALPGLPGPVKLSPVIQDVELVGHGRAGLLEIANRPDEFGIFHVASRVIVEADCQDADVAALRGLD